MESHWLIGLCKTFSGGLILIKSDLAHLTRAYNENESLKKQLYPVRSQIKWAESLKTEMNNSRQLLDMKSKLQATKTLAADVMPFSGILEAGVDLDAGRSKGASENMLVIANGGLIGSVSKVEDNSTMVNLLTNTENADKISVKIQHGTTTIYGIIVCCDKEK